MDHVLYDELCNTKVSEYERMKAEGDTDRNIAISIDLQLTELVPSCGLFGEVLGWARRNLGKKSFDQLLSFHSANRKLQLGTGDM